MARQKQGTDVRSQAAKAATQYVAPRKLAPGQATQKAGRDTNTGDTVARDTQLRLYQTVDALLNVNRVGDAIRLAIRQQGTIGTAHFNLVEMALTGWRAVAYDLMTEQVSQEAQNTLNSVITRLNTNLDYSLGFDDKIGIERVLEMLINDVVTSSGCGLELVLDKSRMPERLIPFPYDSIEWKQGSAGRYPVQRGSGDETELNHPTIFVSDLHRTPNEAYSHPMFEAALRDGRAYEQFLQDMRRAIRRSGHDRLTVSLDAQRIKEAAPPDVQNDPQKLNTWMEDVRIGVEAIIDRLGPEDALVSYDTAKADLLSSEGSKTDYVSLMNALSGNLATALKSNPSILGLRIEGSQSLSNTESLIYLKIANAMRRPVQEVMSRALTLALRLYGVQAYVEFSFEPIDLRPERELAAFETMKFDRDSRLLSMGQITDLEFSIRQGLGTLPDGYKELSGTGFYAGKTVDASKASPNDGAQERALQPDTPDAAGGSSK